MPCVKKTVRAAFKEFSYFTRETDSGRQIRNVSKPQEPTAHAYGVALRTTQSKVKEGKYSHDTTGRVDFATLS
jgi:hypothetical protein